MSVVERDIAGRDPEPAMTPLTRAEQHLLELLEEIHLTAKEVGIDTKTLYVPWSIRLEAWLWRTSKLFVRR